MSKNADPVIKKERGTSLTLEQYEIIACFLKSGIKPTRKSLKNAGFNGTLTGGRDSGTRTVLARFRCIAKRLAYRELDSELIFKANSKIVLPDNRFEEAITRAHKSHGAKHLNIKWTIQKLSEKYTIGCRQFGISEEIVRMVIKKCKDGSCAKKNKAGMGIMKNFAKKSPKPSGCQCNDSTSTQAMQTDDSSTVPKAKVTNGIPVTLMKLPNGAFGIQPSVGANIPGFTPFRQVPLFDLQTLPSNQMQQHVNNTSYFGQATGMLNVKGMAPYLPISSAENRVFNPVSIPVQIVKVGSQPLIAGQQMFLVNSASSFMNIPNNKLTSNQPIDLSKDSSKILGLDSVVPATPVQPDIEGIKHCNENVPVPQDGYGSSFMSAQHLDQNNNDISSVGTNINMMSGTCEGIWNRCESGQELGINHFYNDLNPCGSYGNGEEVIDLTETEQEDQEMAEATDVDTTLDQDTNLTHSRLGSCTLPPLPHKPIWYFYDDLARQTNPYERISMCIKDMRLDVMKSLAGSSKATERMKKKIHYIQEVISTQKNVTQYYTDLHSAI